MYQNRFETIHFRIDFEFTIFSHFFFKLPTIIQREEGILKRESQKNKPSFRLDLKNQNWVLSYN